MQDKHITGPWRRTSDHQSWRATHEGFGNSCYQAIQDQSTGKVVALVVGHAEFDEPEPDTRAIARMVETTPELLSALSGLVALYDADEGCRAMPEYITARAAISKATGSTP